MFGSQPRSSYPGSASTREHKTIRHEHERDRTSTSNRAWTRRALEHEHEHSSTMTRLPGNQCEPTAESWTTYATRLTFFYVYIYWFAWDWKAVRARIASPVVTCNFSRFWISRASATDFVQGRHLHRGVRAGSLRAQEPEAPEITINSGRKNQNAYVRKSTFMHVRGHVSAT